MSNFSSTAKHYIRNFSWMMLEKIIKVFIGLSVGVYVVRYLGPKDFGILSYGLSIVGVLYPFATLGIDAILFRNIIQDKKNEAAIIYTAKMLRFYASICIVFIALLVLLTIKLYQSISS